MATPHSSVATTAILYRSAACRAAIRAANHSHWERVQWPPNELRAAQKVIALRSSGANVTIPPAVRAHSNAADPCSRIERTPQIMSKLCQLFEVDYACFPSYPRPAACK